MIMRYKPKYFNAKDEIIGIEYAVCRQCFSLQRTFLNLKHRGMYFVGT